MTHAAFILRILREQRDRIITPAKERAFWARVHEPAPPRPARPPHPADQPRLTL